MMDAVLHDIDAYRNLSKSSVVLAFIASGTMGVMAFFLTLDITKWLELDVLEPWMQISVPYVLSILVWIFSFYLIHSALHTLGFRDIGAVAKERLSNLNLSPEQLEQLRHELGAREFKHKCLFEEVINDLEKSVRVPDARS